jgi:hypothetical protein
MEKFFFKFIVGKFRSQAVTLFSVKTRIETYFPRFIDVLINFCGLKPSQPPIVTPHLPTKTLIILGFRLLVSLRCSLIHSALIIAEKRVVKNARLLSNNQKTMNQMEWQR